MRQTLAELRDRKVFKVATAYLVGGGVVLQFGSVLLQNFEAPAWAAKALTLLVLLGFPLACLLAWALELTPQGIRFTRREPGRPPEPRHTDWIWGGLLAATLVFVALQVARDPDPRATEATASGLAGSSAAAPPAPAEVIPSVAVLPFVDMSAAHDQQYFGDGIAEELLNALARIEGLKVAARTSTFLLHARGASMQEIGDTLKVAHVLQGSLRRSGDRVRISAQLIDVKTGYHLFSQSYDRGIADVLVIQDEIARELVGLLLPRLGLEPGTPLVVRETANAEAYELRLAARHAFGRATQATLQQAIERLERAVRLDPLYAAAWGDLSFACTYMSSMVEPLPWMMRAQVAANRALAIDPDNAMALIVLAQGAAVVDYDQAKAGRLFERARETGTDLSFWVFTTARVHLVPLERYAEALAIVQQARALDPLAPTLLQIEMGALMALDRAEEVCALARGVRAEDSPSSNVAYAALLACPSLRADRQRMDSLIDYIRTSFGEFSWQSISSQALVNNARGDPRATKRLLDEVMKHRHAGFYVSPHAVGWLHAWLGDKDAALDWFTRAADAREPAMIIIFPTAVRRGYPKGEFPGGEALLRRMGLTGGGVNGT